MKLLQVTTRKPESVVYLNPRNIVMVREHRDVNDGTTFVVIDTTEAQLGIKESLTEIMSQIHEC